MTTPSSIWRRFPAPKRVIAFDQAQRAQVFSRTYVRLERVDAKG